MASDSERDDARDDYPPGDSATTNPSAPPSSGDLQGSEGVVDPTSGPDLRPATAAKERGARPGPDESTVPSPSGGADEGSGLQTGSSGAASAGAGSGRSHGEGHGHGEEGTTRGTGSSRPGGNPQTSGSPTSGTGAPTGDRKEDPDRDG